MTIPRNLSFLAEGASSTGVLAVTNGGTGVTSSSGANSVMLRDANQNVSINRLNQSSTTTTAAAGTTVLTAASTFSQILNGTGGQTFRLPDATTLTNTTTFEFNNNATGTLTIVDNASGAVGTITSGGAAAIALLSNGTVAGTWDVHAYIPENVQWGTNSLALGSTVISGGTWQGGTIASGYGGTGLTTFTAANNALYSTSASALAAGTLPVLAGGTGVTTSTGSGNNVLSTSPTLVTPVLGTPSSGTLTNCTGYTTANLSGTVSLTTQVSGTLPVANGGTGTTTSTGSGSVVLSTSPTLTTPNLGTPSALVGTNITGTASGLSIGGNAATATTATNQSGGTVSATTGTFSGAVSANAGIGGTLRRGSYGSLSINGNNGSWAGLDFYDASATFMTRTTDQYSGLYKNNTTWIWAFDGSGTLVTGTVPGASVSGTVAVANGGTGVTTSTGSGSVVLSTSPTLTTPNLGTPSALVGTNITGTAAGLSIGGNAATATSATTATTANGLNSANSYTAVSFSATSDETIKENWNDIPTSFVSQLTEVKHGTYNRIGSANREVGVSAQSLEKVLKEAIVKSEDGLLSVNYGNAALVAAIELAKEVVELRKEIELLKAR
jgi:hypothetical protein